jgi:hypothetical protein
MLIGFIFVSCQSDNKSNSELNFNPNITYESINDIVNVRMSLPNGGSKIIYTLNEPILESGKKLDFMGVTPISGTNFLNGDSTFQLVNTSFAKTSGGRYNISYVYKKNQSVLVYMEMTEVQGIVDFKTIYKGNIYEESNDSLVDPAISSSQTVSKKIIKFVSNDNTNEDELNLVFNGEDVIMEFFNRGEMTRILKGNYVNGKLFMDDDSHYELKNSSICYSIEGAEYCYVKVSEKSIY